MFDRDRPTVPYLIVEVKQTKLKDGKEQLKSYTHATGAPLALWSNGAQTIQWHRKNPNYFVELPDIPRAWQSIEDIVDQPWTIQTLIDKENEREKESFKARSLRDLIVDLEDEVLANAGVDVFEEVFKLVFAAGFDDLDRSGKLAAAQVEALANRVLGGIEFGLGPVDLLRKHARDAKEIGSGALLRKGASLAFLDVVDRPVLETGKDLVESREACADDDDIGQSLVAMLFSPP